MKLSLALQKAAKVLVKNKTKILTGGAMVGVALVAIESLREGPEIAEAIRETMKDLEETPKDDKETRKVIHKEAIRKVAPRAGKIIFLVIATISCIHGLNVEHSRNYAAAAALAAASQQKLKEYEDIAKDVVGPKKIEEMREKYAERKAKDEPKFEDKDGFDGKGFLVYDPQSGFKFHISDPVDLKNARADLQDELNNLVPWVSVNDFYCHACDRFVDIRYCKRWGWNQGRHIDVDWRIGADNEGHPCYILMYSPELRLKASGDLDDYDDYDYSIY